jgi:hypothetical protein
VDGSEQFLLGAFYAISIYLSVQANHPYLDDDDDSYGNESFLCVWELEAS